MSPYDVASVFYNVSAFFGAILFLVLLFGTIIHFSEKWDWDKK